jgi:predicted Zn-dependent protease
MRPRCSERRGARGAPSLAALALAAALGCASPTPGEEAQLGAQMHQQLLHEAWLLQDRVVVRYVAELGHRIAEVAGPSETGYRFYVVVDPEVNAFAAPGGYIYVNAGTILAARNVSELAAVLAHEIGHVARRHLAENVARRRTASTARQIGVLAGAVAAGPAGASAASLLGGIASMAALNSFGREAEREADAFAVEVLPRAGYDPEGVATFFQTLMHQSGEAAAGEFLSDHPATASRVEETLAAIAAQDLPAGLRSDDGGRLEIIQQRIRLLTGAAVPSGAVR